MLPHIKYIMKSLQSPLLVQLQEEMDELEDLFALDGYSDCGRTAD